MGIKVRVLHVLRLAISTVARFFFSLYYGNEGAKIPAITDDILKKPAVEVAKKIRNKEVTKHLVQIYLLYRWRLLLFNSMASRVGRKI